MDLIHVINNNFFKRIWKNFNIPEKKRSINLIKRKRIKKGEWYINRIINLRFRESRKNLNQLGGNR